MSSTASLTKAPSEDQHTRILKLYLEKLNAMPDLPTDSKDQANPPTMAMYFRELLELPARPSSTTPSRMPAMDTYFKQLKFLSKLPGGTRTFESTDFWDWSETRPRYRAAFEEFLETTGIIELVAKKGRGIKKYRRAVEDVFGEGEGVEDGDGELGKEDESEEHKEAVKYCERIKNALRKLGFGVKEKKEEGKEEGKEEVVDKET